MIYTIENEVLRVEIDSLGAQMMSFRSKKTGVEYLWQGDKTYWGGRAYNLFPTIGRMIDNEYLYEGKRYPLRSHGLVRYYELTPQPQTKQNEISFTLTHESAEDIPSQYPFQFLYTVTFSLQGNRLTVRYFTENRGARTLICAFGGHPGINVPFDGGAFEDYYVEFETPKQVTQCLMSPRKFMSGETAPYPLQEGTKLPLRHELFDDDAIILTNTGSAASLKRNGSSRYVKMDYKGFKYFALWHAVGNAPYVCFEPWQALCANDGETTDLSTKRDMTHVAAGDTASAAFTIEIGE